MILRLNDIVNKLNDKNIKVSELAEFTGIHENTIRKIKNGINKNPTYEVMECLSDFFSSTDKKGRVKPSILLDNIKETFSKKEMGAFVGFLNKFRNGDIIESVNSKRIVYGLVDGHGEIVYIGKSNTHGLGRALSHINSKKVFESVVFFPVDEDSSSEKVESALILHYRPKYNAPDKRYKSTNKFFGLPLLSVSITDYLEDKNNNE